MKTTLVTLVLFQSVEFTTIKVFDTRMKSIVANGSVARTENQNIAQLLPKIAQNVATKTKTKN